jgi:hypothetical protein
MVCKPKAWGPVNKKLVPKTISDLRGGYLCTPSGSVYNKLRLLTSHDIDHFYIQINPNNYQEMCNVLNGLQSEAFEIDKTFLEFVQKNYDYLAC